MQLVIASWRSRNDSEAIADEAISFGERTLLKAYVYRRRLLRDTRLRSHFDVFRSNDQCIVFLFCGMINWESSDSWLLQTLLMTCGDHASSASMRSVIATGDYINHAVFSLEELLHGSTRLAAIDFLQFENGNFRLTSDFQQQLLKLKKRPKNVIKSMQQLDEWLRTQSLTSQACEEALRHLKKEALEKFYTMALAQYSNG